MPRAVHWRLQRPRSVPRASPIGAGDPEPIDQDADCERRPGAGPAHGGELTSVMPQRNGGGHDPGRVISVRPPAETAAVNMAAAMIASIGAR